MRGAAFLVCAITAILGKEIKLNKNGCPIDYTIEKLIPHSSCNKFYQCFHGTLVERKCSDTLLFNKIKNMCDWPQNVECRIQLEDENNKVNDKNEDHDKNQNNSGQEKCKCNPKEAEKICAKSGSEDELVAHENCNKFYKCSHGKNISMRCPGTLLYNPFKEWCDFPENVKCGDRTIPDPEEDEKEPDNDGEGDNDNDNNDKGSCNCVPGEAPSICAKPKSDGVLVAHEHCNKFYKCSWGKNISMRCPGTLLYNPFKEWCDFPENVKCGDRTIPDPEEDEKEPDNDGGGDNDNDNNDKGSCNCVPGEAPSICAKPESDGVLVAHEHCNKFYKCSWGKNISMRCPGTLLYNPFKEWCDFPENVKCGDRTIPDPEEDEKEPDNDGGGDNDNDNNDKGSCNCVPGEAPSICAKPESDGVLVAHEHCNKFYKCSHGKNISMRCPGTLLYNPLKEWCDFPENVKCGDRTIPDPEEDEKEPDNDGGGDNDNDNNDKGSCNCVPGEAPSICAKPESDGVLVAHEHCNKFYKCSWGKNISMRCPGTLLYNPFKEWCDFPENVKCGDRTIPDPEEDEKEPDNDGGGDNDNDNNDKGSCNCVPGEAPSICAKPESDGVLVAHEHCNKFYKCSWGKNISMRCPGTLLYNPFKEWCDFPENVKCGDRTIPDPEEDEKEPDNDGGGDNDNDNNDKGSCNCVPGEAPSICAKPESDGVLVAHEHCNKFYKCSWGKNISMRCPGTLLYNPFKEWCDFPENVKCGDRTIEDPEEDEKEPDNDGGGDNDNDNNDKGSCNCVPGEAPSICAKPESDGVLVAHEHCNKFYKCSHGKNISMRCPGTLLYNPFKEWCDFPENVKCGDRTIPDPEEDEKEPDNDGGGDNDNDNNDKGSCNCVPGEAPSICAKPESDGVLVAHEHCNKFYKCSHGKNISMRCPGTLLYNPFKEWCDFPENVKCGDRTIPDPEEDEKEPDNDGGGDNDNDNNDKGSCNCVPGEAPSICAKPESDGVLVAHEHCNKFYKCSHGKNISMRCPGTLLYNPFKEWCDFPENVKCGDRTIPDPEEDEKEPDNDGGGDNDNDNNDKGSCNCVPGEAPSICAKPESDGVLVAHEHCNKFYKCSWGKNISMRCPGTLLYNPFKEWCDFPENVKCGDRTIPNPEEDEKEPDNDGGGDNDNDNNDKGSCNCVPGEAPSICAKPESDGVLVAHEHCNKFYKCSHGKNISMRCPGTLLYNPFKEWCDFPENVKCGDRTIPDPEEDEKEPDNDGGGDNDNDNNDKGSCNCVPGEAPSICAKPESDGVLVAHEHCNKFYKCSHGKNISMRCPGTLLYNPFKEWCDFPENVKCGDRTIPDPEEDEKEPDNDGGGDNDNDNNDKGSCNCVPGEAPSICAKPESDGVLVAHEHCNKFYKCSWGKNISMRCPGTLLYNPFKEWCDFPENVKCGGRTIPDPEEDEKEPDNDGGGDNDNDNNDKGSCNCVPGEAPSICAKPESDGVLVAHEHCNKFYKCSWGKNISMRCPGTLLYNPFKEWCDFPENVKCGDRTIPNPEEDEKEPDNDGGGDNDNDNNDKGSCNCVPGEAPSICAKPESDGVLVAHEHCNKFYKCSHGKNISMRCPGTLLYNPFKEWCDFPENVKCGDRTIPDPEEDEKEPDNDGGGDNDNDNNDKGSCNCVPGEAPSICAKPESDGVLVAHEHCNKFYKCSHGKNISMRCPGTLLYNPFKEWCDFPENVKCGDRTIPDPEEDEKEPDNDGEGDNDNDNNDKGSCNCVPGEAPSICAKPESDGVLVAHEHCNKFYKCSWGKNISMRCPGTLLYNPFKVWCDFPENVKCGDRTIPDPEDDEKKPEQEDNGIGNNDNGSSNCNPVEAPAICAKDGSDSVLVAHEHCNMFYTCSHGKNIAMICPEKLLYNSLKEWCDFPANVQCGDRIVSNENQNNDHEVQL